MVSIKNCPYFFKPTIFLLLLLTIQAQSFGWGQTGHRVIGQIAEWHLSKRTYQQISKILGPESMAMASTWMDEIRSDTTYNFTYTWHWVTIPTGQQYDQAIQEPTGNAYAALQNIITALKSDTLSSLEEEAYLKMLIHLVGDLHQPLHVGTGEDRGGNDVQVQWMGEDTNLHSVWDSRMIDSKQLSFTELAQHLNRQITKQLRKNWQAASLADWLKEAMALRAAVYDIPEDHSLGYHYLYKNYPIVEQRLLVAGVRLAGILNEIYG